MFDKIFMNILLGDFNAKVGREDIFKLTIGNESLHRDSNGNGVRIVNFATSNKSSYFSVYTMHFHNIFVINQPMHTLLV
jgi:hypothetical protein